MQGGSNKNGGVRMLLVPIHMNRHCSRAYAHSMCLPTEGMLFSDPPFLTYFKTSFSRPKS